MRHGGKKKGEKWEKGKREIGGYHHTEKILKEESVDTRELRTLNMDTVVQEAKDTYI